MMSDMDETEFKQRAPELFKELKERAEGLKDIEAVVDEMVKLISEAESFFNKENVTASQDKYREALRRIERAEMSLRSDSLAWRLLWLELGYLVSLLLLGYLTYRWPLFRLWNGLINLSIQTAWFGALGGVTIAIYGIYNHIQTRDFDPKYKLWYICKPIMGGIFGWFVYLIYFIGLISVQGIQNVEIHTPEFPFAIAFLAGFSERFTIRMIDKLMAVLTTWEEKPADGAFKANAPK
ncbi:MAG: hypothetical protein WCE90_01740 [Candidatus Zixiibacteriota bacterium]|jgi:hypothetical protein